MSDIPKYVAVDSDCDETISVWGEGETMDEAIADFKKKWLYDYGEPEPMKIEVHSPDEPTDMVIENYGWSWMIGDYNPLKVVEWNMLKEEL